MSTKQKKEAVADWRVKSQQVNEARKKRGISAENHGLARINMYIQPNNDEMNSSGRTAAHPTSVGAGGDSYDPTSEVFAKGAGGRSLRIDGKFWGGR